MGVLTSRDGVTAANAGVAMGAYLDGPVVYRRFGFTCALWMGAGIALLAVVARPGLAAL